jgi:hypothetical protein
MIWSRTRIGTSHIHALFCTYCYIHGIYVYENQSSTKSVFKFIKDNVSGFLALPETGKEGVWMWATFWKGSLIVPEVNIKNKFIPSLYKYLTLMYVNSSHIDISHYWVLTITAILNSIWRNVHILNDINLFSLLVIGGKTLLYCQNSGAVKSSVAWEPWGVIK